MAQHPTQTYECADCGRRLRTDKPSSRCAACGGEMLNLSTARNS
ncbi:rubrerythrin-like domain-containing protein [Haloprofundus marisrubri]|nr:rubrerythrin-like domain-containing protein [Haloprofundus marisrubri]